MAKKSPILAVNESENKASRKRPAVRQTTGRRKTASGKPSGRKTPKGKKKIRQWQMPSWCYYLLLGGVGACFVICFYYFFIRPYAYRWKPCYGMKAYGVCLPYGFEVHGFDVSHHQGNIDWGELQKTQTSPFPVRFVFMKASEGGDFSDTAFIHNFDEARQADFFIRSVKLESGDLPPVLDIEVRGENEKKLRHDLKIWLDKIEHYYRVKPILYTSYKFKTRYLNDSVFNSYPYWIAHYYADSVEYKGQWRFWQHTDVGRLPGIREEVDLNVFNGTLDELKRMTIP